MGLKSKWKKLCAFGYVLTYVTTHRRNVSDSDRILIYFDGHMGDALMDAGAVEALIKFYTEQGKQVYLAGTELIKTTLLLVMPLDQVTFIAVKDHDVDHGDVREVMQTLEGMTFERLITIAPWDKLFTLNLTACVDSRESWEIVHSRKNFTVSAWMALLRSLRSGYTHRMLTYAGMAQTEREKILLHALGVKEFQTSIAYIPKQCDYSVPGPYVTIAVDSLHAQRRWPTEKNIALVKKLLDEWNADVYLTGSRLERSELDKYEQALQNNERVKIMIGCQTLSEWIELIRGSSLHIGVDSGSIHVAASVGTKSFCLTGVWDDTRCFPYQRDQVLSGTVVPICVYRSDTDVQRLSCRGCFGEKEYGYGNRACLQACRHQQPCLCLANITVDDVMAAIQNADQVTGA